MGANFRCEFCEKAFPKSKTLQRHIGAFHMPTQDNSGLICAICKVGFLRGDAFENHIALQHNVVVDKEVVNFATHAAFMSWKKVIECQQSAQFMTRSRHNAVNKRVYYFRCNRSGTAVMIKEEARKRCLKVQGSRKTNFYCPARMTASVFDDGTVEVEFTKTHFGHEMELKHIKKGLVTDINAVLPKTTYRLRQLRLRHKLALTIREDCVVNKVDDHWGVFFHGVVFHVRLVGKCCRDCDLPCHACKTCSHVFNCSCRVSQTKEYMCEHAHLVSMHVGGDNSKNSEVDPKHQILEDFTELLKKCETVQETAFVREVVNRTGLEVDAMKDLKPILN